jgi:hypothetical protein
MSAITTETPASELLAIVMSPPETPSVGSAEEQRARDLVEQSLVGVTEDKLRQAINAALVSTDSTGRERLMLMRSSYDLPTARLGLVCYRARLVLPKLVARWAAEARHAALRLQLFGDGLTTVPEQSAVLPAATVRVVEANPTLTAVEAESLRLTLMDMLASAHMRHQMWMSFRTTRHEHFIDVLKTPLPATASPWQIDTLHRALRIAGRKFIAMREKMAAE